MMASARLEQHVGADLAMPSGRAPARRAVPQHSHAEAEPGHLGDAPADGAHTDDAERAATEFTGLLGQAACCVPSVVTQCRVHGGEAASQMEQGADGVFRDRLRVAAREVGDSDAARCCCLDRDEVEPDAMAHQSLQSGAVRDDVVRQLGADNDTVRLRGQKAERVRLRVWRGDQPGFRREQRFRFPDGAGWSAGWWDAQPCRAGPAITGLRRRPSPSTQAQTLCPGRSHAGSSAINGWTVRWTLGSGQTITQVWNGMLSASGSAVAVSNAGYNGSVPAAGSTTFGFIANGTPSTPALTCTSP